MKTRLALLIGVLLDQQVSMDSVFAGRKELFNRIGAIDARQIADHDPGKFTALCAELPDPVGYGPRRGSSDWPPPFLTRC